MLHAGEEKTFELFVSIVESHFPTDKKSWYTTDKLLKETLDALKSVHSENEDLKKSRQILIARMDKLREDLEKVKVESETYKNLFLMSGGKTA